MSTTDTPLAAEQQIALSLVRLLIGMSPPKELGAAAAWLQAEAALRNLGDGHLERFLNAAKYVIAFAESYAAENAQELRRLLWVNHGCAVGALYGDDGEMQCGRCLIDFKRLPVVEIERELIRARGGLINERIQ